MRCQSLLLCDVSTLYFETDHGDGFREPGLCESIDARPSIVLVALAVTRVIEDCTGWSIKRFVRTAAAADPSRSALASTS
jgi:hypothetical protein